LAVNLAVSSFVDFFEFRKFGNEILYKKKIKFPKACDKDLKKINPNLYLPYA